MQFSKILQIQSYPTFFLLLSKRQYFERTKIDKLLNILFILKHYVTHNIQLLHLKRGDFMFLFP